LRQCADEDYLVTHNLLVRAEFDDLVVNVINFDEIGLEERVDLLNELQQIVVYNLRNWRATSSTCHIILFIGGACGIGKTRLGKELYLHCSKALKGSMYVYIEADEINSDELANNVEHILIEMASRYRKKVSSNDNPLVIFLHIDEIQRMKNKDKDHFQVLHRNLTTFMAGAEGQQKHSTRFRSYLCWLECQQDSWCHKFCLGDWKCLFQTLEFILPHPLHYSPSSSERFLRNLLQAYVKRHELKQSQVELFMQNEGVKYTLASLGGLPRAIEILARVLVFADESISSNREALFDASSHWYFNDIWSQILDQYAW
jgi:hypothetical protein